MDNSCEGVPNSQSDGQINNEQGISRSKIYHTTIMCWVQRRRSLLSLLAPLSLCWTWRCHIVIQNLVSIICTVSSLQDLHWCQFYFWTIYTSVNILWYFCSKVPMSIYFDTWHSHISHWSISSACKVPTNKAWNTRFFWLKMHKSPIIF